MKQLKQHQLNWVFVYNISHLSSIPFPYALEIIYVWIGILVEWKNPVCSSDGVDSNGNASTLNAFSSHAFKKVRKVSSFRNVAAIMN